jgi:UDP-glucuronate decarboxylase
MQRKPDIAQARKLLEWSPTVDLDDGLRRTIGYFRELLAV